MAKNSFSIFLFLKVSVSHIPTGKKYFLVIPIFKSTCPTYSHWPRIFSRVSFFKNTRPTYSYVFLYLKVLHWPRILSRFSTVPHIPTGQEYFLGFLIFKSIPCPHIFLLAKIIFLLFLFLKVPVQHIPIGQEYFLGFLFSKIPVQHIPTAQEYFLCFLIFKSICLTYFHWPRILSRFSYF